MKHEKIGPGLTAAFKQFQDRGEAALIPRIRTFGIVPSAGTSKPARTVVFIECDPHANLNHLTLHGIRINQHTVLNGWYPGSSSLEISLRSPQNLVTPLMILPISVVKGRCVMEPENPI